MRQQLAALQGNYARVGLIVPPPASLHPLPLSVAVPSAVCFSKKKKPNLIAVSALA